MKKILSTLLALLLLVSVLGACTETPEPEHTEPLVQAETPAPEPTPEPIETPEPEPEETPEPAELPVPVEMMFTNVRVYYVADAYFNQPGLTPHELVDLAELGNYHEFEEPEEIPQRIIFKTDAPVENFRYLALGTAEDGAGFIVEEILYQLDEFTPEVPFVASWWTLSTAMVHRGISFVDDEGITRYFAFHASGYDGALFFIAFEPV